MQPIIAPFYNAPVTLITAILIMQICHTKLLHKIHNLKVSHDPNHFQTSNPVPLDIGRINFQNGLLGSSNPLRRMQIEHLSIHSVTTSVMHCVKLMLGMKSPCCSAVGQMGQEENLPNCFMVKGLP